MDRERNWESLDDKRYCQRCRTIFSGRQVDVIGGTRDLGRLRLLCPTEGCLSTPKEWFYPDEQLGPKPFCSSQPCQPGGARLATSEPTRRKENAHIVRVLHKRISRERTVRSAPRDADGDESQSLGALKKIARFLHGVRARA
jgi:hypothetical protein